MVSLTQNRNNPYGNLVSKSGPLSDANVYRFSSKELHVNSGLYYYLYRFYSPNWQRWINRDTIQEVGHTLLTKYDLPEDAEPNLSWFVQNSPTKYVDPFGAAVRGTAGRVKLPKQAKIPKKDPLDWNAPDAPSMPDCDMNVVKSAWKKLKDCDSDTGGDDECADICAFLTSVYDTTINQAVCLRACRLAYKKRCEK